MLKKSQTWKKGTAGFYMVLNVPIVPNYYSVKETKDYLKENINKIESIEYIYIIDDFQKLVGVISHKDLYNNLESAKIKSLIKNKKLIKIYPEDKPEFVAHLSLKHGLSAIPVVNSDLIFLGAVTRQNILEILHRKHIEEKFHLAGIRHSHSNYDDIFKLSIFQSIKHRLLWLIIGLIGGILAAKIVNNFESTLSQNILLAAFIPLIVYIADAVGTQLEAFSIRDFSLFKDINFRNYFFRQFLIIFLIAIILGAISTLITMPFIDNTISIILGISIFGATISSTITGLLIPFIFRKFKSDPVNGSGPIGTIIQDILSVVIYFVIASLLLS